MSRELADYLDAASVIEARSALGTTFVPAGTIAPMPVPGATQLTPDRLAPAIQEAVNAIADSAQRAAIDAAMWTLDNKWLPDAVFADMRVCSRVVDLTAHQRKTQAWADPDVVGNGCKDFMGRPVNSTCDWGFWRLMKCDIQTAGTQAFQYPRYLWAQARMRELLARKPVPGVTKAADAAAWTWQAAQYVSVLLWSTNIRFDNPNPVRGLDYGSDLQNNPAGGGTPLLVRSFGVTARGGRGAGSVVVERPDQSIGIQGSFGLPSDYDGPALDTRNVYTINWPLQIVAWNYVGHSARVPKTQDDFAPRIATEWPTSIVNRNGDAIPPGAPVFLDRPRNATERSLVRDWFTLTWGLDDWVTRGGRDGLYSIGGIQYRLVTSGSRRMVKDMIRMLEHYSRSDLNYIDWMHQAVQTFAVESVTAAAGSDPASISFSRARADLISSIGSASQAAIAAQRAAGSNPTIDVTVSVIGSILTLVLSLIGPIGTLLNALMSYALVGVNALFAAGFDDPGGGPCPAFPFIRVLSPALGECNITTSDIEASLLGIDSNARWPVSIGGQTRTFQIDGKVFTATFTSSDTTAELVARRINAAAALVGLGVVASVRNGQVHVEGRDPGAGPAKATGGTAAALGFPGPVSAPAPTPAPSPTPGPSTGGGGGGSGGTTPSKSSSLPLLVGGALLLRFLLG